MKVFSCSTNSALAGLPGLRAERSSSTERYQVRRNAINQEHVVRLRQVLAPEPRN